MPTISWSSIGVLILASFQLISFFKFQEPEVLNKKAYAIQVLAVFLCSAITVSFLLLLPQTFPVLLILAVAGAVKIILLATSKLKNIHINEDEKCQTPTDYVKTVAQIKPLETIYEKDSNNAPDILTRNPTNEIPKIARTTENQPPLQTPEDKFRQYQERESQQLQYIAYLNQKLQNSPNAPSRKENKPEEPVQNIYQNFLTNQLSSGKPEQPSVVNNPPPLEKPIEIEQYYEDNQQDKSANSPFLRAHIVPPKKMPGLRFR